MCFDQSQLELANIYESTKASYLGISISIPDSECIESTVTYNKCDTTYDYQAGMDGKSVVILTNQKRIVTDSYDEDGPIIKEAKLTFYPYLSL